MSTSDYFFLILYIISICIHKAKGLIFFRFWMYTFLLNLLLLLLLYFREIICLCVRAWRIFLRLYLSFWTVVFFCTVIACWVRIYFLFFSISYLTFHTYAHSHDDFDDFIILQTIKILFFFIILFFCCVRKFMIQILRMIIKLSIQLRLLTHKWLLKKEKERSTRWYNWFEVCCRLMGAKRYVNPLIEKHVR